MKLQVSHTPGQLIALSGVALGLVGLLGSLFIRPRRIWVRARREGGRTLVEVAGLDRSAGGDLTDEIETFSRLAPAGAHRPRPTARRVVVTHAQYELLSNQAVAACAVVYFLAVLAHLAQWALARKVEVPVERGRQRGRGGLRASRSPRRRDAETTEPSGWRCSAGSAWR